MFREEFSYNIIKKRFINIMMKGGKKSTAEQILNQTFTHIQNQGLNPQEILLTALKKAGPLMTTQPRRRGRTVTHIPVPLMGKKRLGITIKWIIQGARSRNDSNMGVKIAHELISLSKGQGKAIKLQMALHKNAYSNRMHLKI